MERFGIDVPEVVTYGQREGQCVSQRRPVSDRGGAIAISRENPLEERRRAS
jgi:hypothetical protein